MLFRSACDVIVMASDHEGSPVAIREAMACNLPVVSVDVGDVAELIKTVQQCYLVDQNPQAIADGLVKVLSQQARSNGREKVHEYDMIHATQQVYEIYLRILEQT